MDIDDVLAQLRQGLELEAETEHELLDEIRGHLEESIAAAKQQGLDEQEALRQAAARFGVDEAARELHVVHAGWGTLEGVAAAGLPVFLALILRWLVYAPDGTAIAWQQLLERPVFWVVAVAALVIPLLRFPRRRYALALWALFWVLSVVTVAWPTLRW